jgi:hypothetical protein
MEKITVCKSCNGEYPCWCSNKNYVVIYKWIYEFIKRCKG